MSCTTGTIMAYDHTKEISKQIVLHLTIFVSMSQTGRSLIDVFCLQTEPWTWHKSLPSSCFFFFSWGSICCSCSVPIFEVMYNAVTTETYQFYGSKRNPKECPCHVNGSSTPAPMFWKLYTYTKVPRNEPLSPHSGSK